MTITLDRCPSCGVVCVEVTARYCPPIPGTRLDPPEREHFEDIRVSCGCDMEICPEAEEALYGAIGLQVV